MKPRIKRRHERSREFWRPSNPLSVDFNRRVYFPKLVIAAEHHHPPIAKRDSGRVPTTMRHVLNEKRLLSQRIKERHALIAIKRIVLGCATDNHAFTVSEKTAAITENIPTHLLHRDSARRWIPDS